MMPADSPLQTWRAPPLPSAGQPVESTLPEAVREQIAEERRRSQEQGFDQGYRDGQTRAEAELVEHRAQLDALVEALHAPYAARTEALTSSLTQLAITLAEAITRREISLQPEALLRIAASALDSIEASPDRYTLHLNPADLQRLQGLDLPLPEGMTLDADAELAAGDSEIRFYESHVDLRIAAQLATALETLESVDTATPENIARDTI